MSDTVELPADRVKLLENSAKLLNELWNDPKEGLNVKRAWKNKFPDAVVPDVDIAIAKEKMEAEILSKVEAKEKAIDEKINAWQKDHQEHQKSVKEAKEAEAFEKEISNVQKKYQLTAEGMEKVFARMKEKNNPDVESAAAWVTDNEPRPNPTDKSSYSPSEMNLYGSSNGDKEWEALNRNPMKFFDNTVSDMLNDFNSGQFNKYREFGGSL